MRVYFYVVSEISGAKKIPHSRHYTEEAAFRAASKLNIIFINQGIPREAKVMAGLGHGKLHDPDINLMEPVENG